MALKLSLKAATTKTSAKAAAPVASSEAMDAATEYRNIALEMDGVKARLAVARDALMDIVGDVREDARARAVTRGRWARDRPIGRWFALPRRGAIGEPMPASRAPRRARESERD